MATRISSEQRRWLSGPLLGMLGRGHTGLPSGSVLGAGSLGKPRPRRTAPRERLAAKENQHRERAELKTDPGDII